MSQMKRARSKKSKKDDEEENEAVWESQINAAVNRILVLDRSKKAFKQSEVLSALEHKVASKLKQRFFGTVKDRLEEIGFSLHVDDSGPPIMILSASEKPIPFMRRLASEEEKADRTLLILVLSLILMKEGAVTEDDVFKFLKKLHIKTENGEIHEYFGDVAMKIQTQFVDELYISRSQMDNGQIQLEWGFRAMREVSKKDVLEFVCKIGYDGRRQPDQFASQHKEAEEQDIEEGEVTAEEEDDE